MYMWQSGVDYSVAYSDRIAVFETGGANMRFYEARMSPAPNTSSAIWRKERSDEIETRKRNTLLHGTATCVDIPVTVQFSQATPTFGYYTVLWSSKYTPRCNLKDHPRVK